MLYPQTNRCRTVMDLGGFWSFQIDPAGIGENAEWYKGLPAPRLIAVPGSWNELWAEYRDYLDDAWYFHRFEIPQKCIGSRLVLRFGSVNYHARIWLNEVCLGEHDGGHLPFEFEVTSHARTGENVLAVKVNNTLSPQRVPTGNSPASPLAAFMNNLPPANFDFFPYAGIHRPVTLYTTDITYIKSLKVHTSFDADDTAENVIGWLDLEAAVSWPDQAENGVVVCTVRDVSGVIVSQQLDREGNRAHGRLRISPAHLWSPDSPYLYRCDFTLLDAGEEIRDCYGLDVGIRTVEIANSEILLNGEPIELKGFGKHEDFAVHGRAINVPLIAKDGALFDWIGANSYRTSHYPYSEESMMYADRAGILIIDEIPAVGLMFDDGEENVAIRREICKKQLTELIQRDINHPSVIMWSVANEPMPINMMQRFRGQEIDEAVDKPATEFFDDLIAHGRYLDATRPFSLAGVMGGPVAWLDLCDVIMVNRYWGWYRHGGSLDKAREVLAQELDSLHNQLQKPIIISEFGADTIAGQHSDPPVMFSEEYQVEMLRVYLDVAAARPFVAGLHVWNFADFKTGQSPMRFNAMNYKGVFTRDRTPKMAAHFLRSRWAPS